MPGDNAAGDAAELTAGMGELAKTIAAVPKLTGLEAPTGVI
jgi:hypothetical protein